MYGFSMTISNLNLLIGGQIVEYLNKFKYMEGQIVEYLNKFKYMEGQIVEYFSFASL